MKRIDFTQAQLDYMFEQYSNNKKTIKELASEFDCSRSTIERRLKEKGVMLKPKFPYEDLTGKTFGKLLVIQVNQERYERDVANTNKPHRYWTCLCECGRLTDVESSHLKNGHTISCGCVKSKGERDITKILIENNISFCSEVPFDDLKGYGNGNLRFDFGIIKNGKVAYLIEFNGKQHYEKTGGWCTNKEFEIRQFNDKIKIEYCKANNIPLIIIPHTHLGKIKLEDLKIETTSFLI